MLKDKERKVLSNHLSFDKEKRSLKRPFIKPELTRHERLHQVARFGQASSVAGLQTVGVAS